MDRPLRKRQRRLLSLNVERLISGGKIGEAYFRNGSSPPRLYGPVARGEISPSLRGGQLSLALLTLMVASAAEPNVGLMAED